MKYLALLTVPVVVCVWLIFVSPALSPACTVITAAKGSTVLFGGNEDQMPNDCFFVVDKSGPIGGVYFATPWDRHPLVMQMGINEKGLCYDVNWIPEEKLTPHPERTPQRRWAVTRLMRESSSVAEVLARIFTYNWGDAISYQVHFADRSGDAAVIHPGENGELTFTRIEKEKGYLVSTNFNLARRDKGNWSCRRYKNADKMLSTLAGDTDLTPQFMASVLQVTHQYLKYKTLYSAVYDLRNLRIYLYTDRRFGTPCVLDVNTALAGLADHRKFSIISLKELVVTMAK